MIWVSHAGTVEEQVLWDITPRRYGLTPHKSCILNTPQLKCKYQPLNAE